MRRIHRGIRLSRTYKRFVISFLIVLVVPVFCFSYIFLKNYRNIYRQNIIEQAEYTLSAVGMEWERDIENLWAIVFYNELNTNTLKKSFLEDYTGRKMKTLLNAEMVTNRGIENIYYYNDHNQDIIYSKDGTYSVEYYARLYAGMDSDDQFMEFLQNMESTQWMLKKNKSAVGMEETAALQYIIHLNDHEWWIFTIDTKLLHQIIDREDSVTILYDTAGNELFSTGEKPENSFYEVTFHSPGGYFSLIRYIDETSLFEELNDWQRCFFFAVMLILFIGGILVLVLTHYSEHPIRELVNYCREKNHNIPEETCGLDAFRYAMISMEEQVKAAERQQSRNLVLMQLLYGENCNNELLRYAMSEADLFVHAQCWRVILVYAGNGHCTDFNKVKLYLDMKKEKMEIEFQTLEFLNEEMLIMIAGMTILADDKMESVLQCIADDLKESINEEVCFYVGGRCLDLTKINLSYAQALSSSHSGSLQSNGKVVLYQPNGKGVNKVQYPKDEINALYDALIEVDLVKIMEMTDILIDYLQKQEADSFVSVALYYDVLNAFYRAQSNLQQGIESEFSQMDFWKIRKNSEAVQVIIRLRNQYMSCMKEYGKKHEFEGEEQQKELIDQAEFVCKVLQYIDENDENTELSVGVVSDYFNISIYNLSRKFKAQTGENISNYITAKKFVYATRLLKETDYNVKEIAVMVGYSSSVSFIRKFKQQCGMTPTEYRTEHREK